jgi:hypothetical protein
MVGPTNSGNDKAGLFRGLSEPSFISSSTPRLSETQEEEGGPGESILAEEAEWERMSRRNSVSSDSPRFPGGDSNVAPPVPPPRRRFVRAHSVTGASPNDPSRGIPRPNPTMKRSSSVSTSMSSSRNSTSSFLSTSVASSLDRFGSEGRDCENYDPNYDPFDDDASPKRSANVYSNARERFKIRPASHQQGVFTASNDISALESGRGSSSIKSRGSKTEAAPESFWILARRHGEPLSTWAGTPLGGVAPSPMGSCNSITSGVASLSCQFPSSPPFDGDSEDDDEIATVYSPASISMASSSRKRGFSASPQSDDGSPPQVPRAKSRIFSPVPSAPMSSERSLLLSVGSKTSQLHDYNLMDVSIYPTSGRKLDRPVVDVILSDDDANHADDSIDDISIDSGNKTTGTVPISHAFRSRQASSAYGSRILVPDRACVDDVIQSMSSYEDVLFLVNSLDKEKEKGVFVSWCVVPRSEWDSNRRNSFFNWTLGTLGFALDYAGGNVKYVKISKTKGRQLLSLLRSALNACKERGIGSISPSSNRNSTLPMEFTLPPIKGGLPTNGESIVMTHE